MHTKLTRRLLAYMARLALMSALIAAALTAAPLARAASFAVTTLADNVPGSLREAVLNANATSGADTITFGVTGTIRLASPLPDITDNLTIAGPGAAKLTISGGDAVRIFSVPPGITLNLSRLTLSHGAGSPEGGAINNSGSLNVSDTTFSNNSSSVGGAILNTGSANIANSEIADNTASSYAAALYNRGGVVTLRNTSVSYNDSPNAAGIMNDQFGKLHVIGSTFNDNTATAPNDTPRPGSVAPFQSGIAINNLGAMDITGSEFYGHVALAVNGTIANFGTATIADSYVFSNLAWLGGAVANSGTLSIAGSTFKFNQAWRSGGAILNTGTLVVSNSTISNSGSSAYGSGIASETGSLTVINTTLVDNLTPSGQSSNLVVNSGAFTMKNTLLSNSGIQGSDCSGGVLPSAGSTHNLATDGSCGPSATVVAASDLRLAQPGQNGGPTPTIALQLASVAINAGDPATCAADPVNNLDQRGVARPQGARCDVGAFELAPANHPPVAADQSATTTQDVPVAITLGATDADNNQLSYAVVGAPAHGALSGTAPSLTYTPAAGYVGADSFTFKASDGQADSNVATVAISVQAINHPPVAANDSYSAVAGQRLVVDYLHGVLLNDSDPDLTPLTAIKVSDPAHGALVLNADGSLTYTPAAGFSGTDSFTYKASDHANDSNVATVSITVGAPYTVRITIVLDAQPDSATNLKFTGSLGTFYLDDIAPQDTDAYASSKTFSVAPGTYTVAQALPAGWYIANISCSPPAGTIADIAKSQITINAAPGTNITCTFVVQRAGQIVASVYNDHNHNHKRDSGDEWLPGWQIQTYSAQTGQSAAQTTNRKGRATFTNVRPGDYAVCATLKAGWYSISPGGTDARYGQPCYAVTVAPGKSATVLFGNSTTP